MSFALNGTLPGGGVPMSVDDPSVFKYDPDLPSTLTAIKPAMSAVRCLCVRRSALVPTRVRSMQHVVRMTTQPIALLSVLNQLDEGIILLDGRCNAFWTNTAFSAAIRADPECDRIMIETRRLAATVATVAPAPPPEESSRWASATTPALSVARADLSTRVASYSLRATMLGRDVDFVERPFDVVVSMARVVRRVPDIGALVDRFGLTPSEASVALLLVRGMANREIARTLGVSAHTARHHTENVLVKLHVHTRAAVGAMVLDAAWPGRAHDRPIR